MHPAQLLSIALAAAVIAAAPVRAQQSSQLTSEFERSSYAVGIAFGRSLKQQGIKEVNVDLVIKGLTDEVGGKPLALSEDEFRTIYHAFQQEMISKIGKARDLAARDNKVAGDAFLAQNSKQNGVATLPSGLQYKVLNPGTGAKPDDGDTVTAHYRGTLIDGIEIDNTYRRGAPATFPLKGSIAGWREALKLMPVGAKWQIVVPPELAYSKQGAGRNIGPNATLIFEIELISVSKS